jgi:hypothetical protein
MSAHIGWVLLGLLAWWVAGAFALAAVDVDGALRQWWSKRPPRLALVLEIALVIAWPVVVIAHYQLYVKPRSEDRKSL